jgi:hypothetical protein
LANIPLAVAQGKNNSVLVSMSIRRSNRSWVYEYGFT